ncbi:phytanoyl-CoA dioxygenase family protein [Sphingomonas sp.]|uniref:phytanoyl-CoA dioxygenase family protein n=1 Tax=Sphingomonas sp. TaxID=28214 RepID=UPI002E31024D|nr:phytanoyl-CoA dioxygenase family protein [Sphingomonas sp.]HEX4693596.1 phytanoyl-CoA dioxygenase family protein [Sphingomonas sp.]
MTSHNAEQHTEQLRREGWCIIPDALPAAAIADLDDDLAVTFDCTPFCRGGFYGETTKRFGRLLARSSHAAALVQHRTILDIVGALLSPYCDTIQLNVTQAIAIHPGAPAQLPHRDQDMWAGPKGELEYLVNVIWPLTEFTAANGATMVWPRSHGRQALHAEPDAQPVAAAMSPGSALVFLGSALHGAGANRSRDVRRGIVVGYALGWLKPYENQWLAYPPPVARRFAPDLAALVGYRQHRPNLGNYEGQCPSILLKDIVPDHLAAADALRPDQQAMMDSYIEDQRRPS